MSQKNTLLEKVSWADVRDELYEANPDLVNAVDPLCPNAEYSLYRARYPFGSYLLEKGDFYVPNAKGVIVPITDDSIPADVQKDLNYTGTNPTGVPLHNCGELFLSQDKQVFPFGVMQPGRIFGLWILLDPGMSCHVGKVWNITAGARSLFMLPKIADAQSNKRLKQTFNLRSQTPRNHLMQWEMFREIANTPDFPDDWYMEVLFFSAKWFEDSSDVHWKAFQHYLYESVWKTSGYWRNRYIFDFALSLAQSQRNLKPNPYLTDTVKHLVAMGMGAAPGFGAQIDDRLAPVQQLQQVYLDVYGLKNYVPTFIAPTHFNKERPDQFAYYSLQNPTLLEFSPRSKNYSNPLSDLVEVKHIMESFREFILKESNGFRNNPVYEMSNTVQYDYFHSETDREGEVRSSKEMAGEDRLLQEMMCKNDSVERRFSDASFFVRGCVRLGLQEKK